MTQSPGTATPAPAPVTREGEAARLLDGLVTDLADRLGAPGAPHRLVVGLTGAPGSGKSTLAEDLTARLRRRGLLAGTVPMDGFHLSNAVLDLLGRHGRKGAPDTFDVEGYLAVLDRVRGAGPGGAAGADGEGPRCPEVLAPVYRRDLHEPVAAGSLVTGPGVVVTEGNYLALGSGAWAGVRRRVDLLVALEVAEPVLVERLVARHRAHGRAAADAAHWVRTVDLPNARLVAAGTARCDEVWRLPG